MSADAPEAREVDRLERPAYDHSREANRADEERWVLDPTSQGLVLSLLKMQTERDALARTLRYIAENSVSDATRAYARAALAKAGVS